MVVNCIASKMTPSMLSLAIRASTQTTYNYGKNFHKLSSLPVRNMIIQPTLYNQYASNILANCCFFFLSFHKPIMQQLLCGIQICVMELIIQAFPFQVAIVSLYSLMYEQTNYNQNQQLSKHFRKCVLLFPLENSVVNMSYETRCLDVRLQLITTISSQYSQFSMF